MRTKLFLAFFLVIGIALVSDFIFERLIMNDFDEYIRGTKEDHLYWVVASIEGSYQDGKWNEAFLHESIHWGMMLGFDTRVEDIKGNEIASAHSVMNSLPDPMKRRMEPIIHGHSADGEYEKYPLYIEGGEMGALLIRPLKKEGPVMMKENIFKERGGNFLLISFLISGAGAALIAVFFSLHLTRPIRKLKLASERIAKGDFAARVEPVSGDEIGKLSAAFNYMAEALEKEEALRKRLTSNIAHELRTPLAVMKAHMEGIIDGVVPNTPEGLENIRTEVERLTYLVQGIEDLAKAEASYFSPGESVQVNLGEFLKGVEYAMAPIFRGKGLSFSIAGNEDIEVSTDVDKLDRILKNILSNSLKFTEEGGVWIDYGLEGENFFVSIKDSGAGIPEGEIPKIFKRFFRGKDAPGEGIGIGLSLVKELVDIMKGEIEVHSTVGEGTTFKIRLPVKTGI